MDSQQLPDRSENSESRQRGTLMDAMSGTAAKIGACVILVLGTVALAAVFLGGEGETPPDGNELARFSQEYQFYEHNDYTPLADRGFTLQDVVDGFETQGGAPRRADLVGAGTVTDLRWGFSEVLKFDDGSDARMRNMYLVIDPSIVSTGDDLLGDSGEVIVELSAPPSIQGDPEASQNRLEPLREIIGQEVAFFLVETDPREIVNADTDIEDVDAGRQEDDRLFVPASPGTLLGVDDGRAFPLLSNEQFENRDENLSLLRQLGLDVNEFTTSVVVLSEGAA